MSTASTQQTNTTRLTLRLPEMLIRRVKGEAMLQGVDPSDWAKGVFETALNRAEIAKTITGGRRGQTV